MGPLVLYQMCLFESQSRFRLLICTYDATPWGVYIEMLVLTKKTNMSPVLWSVISVLFMTTILLRTLIHTPPVAHGT